MSWSTRARDPRRHIAVEVSVVEASNGHCLRNIPVVWSKYDMKSFTELSLYLLKLNFTGAVSSSMVTGPNGLTSERLQQTKPGTVLTYKNWISGFFIALKLVFAYNVFNRRHREIRRWGSQSSSLMSGNPQDRHWQ